MIKSLKTLPFLYKVKESKVIVDDGNECDGLTHKDTLLIEISSQLEFQKKQETLLHEVLHVVLEDYHCFDNLICNEAEERLIRYMSPRLLFILQENPEFVNYLRRKR